MRPGNPGGQEPFPRPAHTLGTACGGGGKVLSLSGQLLALALTAAGGAAIALLGDVYRVMKAALGIRRSVGSALLDLAFGVVCGLATFAVLLVANGGELRLASFLGLAGGAAIYWWLLSPLVVWALWSSVCLTVGLLRTTLALLWWLSRRPRPWGTL